MELPKTTIARIVGDFAEVDLGDLRRHQRAQAVVEKLARSPSASLPAALGSDAAVQGCYRLVNNRSVTFEKLLSGHIEATRKRALQAGRVLVVHDTTECSFPDLPVEEIGYLQTGKAGFLLHPSLVLDGGAWRRPLGVIYAETLHRTQRSKRGRRSKASGVETAKWEDRESQRWWRGMKASAEALSGCEEVIHVADREGDSYQLLTNLLAASQRFVIRVRVDRRGRQADAPEAQWSTIKAVASTCQGCMEREVPLSRRAAKATARMTGAHPPRKARLARLRFAATRIVIPRPKYLADPVPAQLELNLVHVTEVDPPPDEPSVEWLLYTTQQITTPPEVAAIVDSYRARWTIEEFNSALKTGCAYEDREFESRHALLAMLALSLPVACEVLALRSLARSTPTAPATGALSVQQLHLLRTLCQGNLAAQPTAGQALLAVAALGGHLPRNGPPGWKVLQRGMTLLLAAETGWNAARSVPRRARNL